MTNVDFLHLSEQMYNEISGFIRDVQRPEGRSHPPENHGKMKAMARLMPPKRAFQDMRRPFYRI